MKCMTSKRNSLDTSYRENRRHWRREELSTSCGGRTQESAGTTRGRCSRVRQGEIHQKRGKHWSGDSVVWSVNRRSSRAGARPPTKPGRRASCLQVLAGANRKFCQQPGLQELKVGYGHPRNLELLEMRLLLVRVSACGSWGEILCAEGLQCLLAKTEVQSKRGLRGA